MRMSVITPQATILSMLLLVTLFLGWSPHSVSAHSTDAKLLLISFDGFRWDYLQRAKENGRQTPNFDRLIAHGVQSRVRNAFVTKTFPNHYTIVTGLYEESHGVVGNTMYDPKTGRVFPGESGTSQSEWWSNGTDKWRGNPLWNVNQDEGKGSLFPRRSGVFYWPGSEAPVHAELPFHYEKYPKNHDDLVPFKSQAETIVSWFIDDDTPINLGFLYNHQPDSLGHRVGPNSPQMYDMIAQLDDDLGHLLSLMEKNHLFHTVNIIITSDHGMSEVTACVDLLQYNLSLTMFDYFGSSPVFNILPKNGTDDLVFDILSKVPHITVYRKEDIPEQYHYKNNRRVLPLLVVADKGYDLCYNTSQHGNGNHGYNNSIEDMHPIFIAHGPAFKSGLTHDIFEIVDIYPLVCEILDMMPALHEGHLDHVRDMLASHDHTFVTLLTYIVCLSFAATLAGVFTVGALKIQRTHRWKLLHIVNPRGMETSSPLLASDMEEEDEIP